MPSLKAAPGRVVLKFPEAIKQYGLIAIPETSQTRPEFPLIHDLGEPLDEKDAQLRRYFDEIRKAGIKIAISYMSGVSYWHPNYDPKVWGWLKAYRVYSYRELASVLIEDDDVAAALGVAVEAVPA